MSLPHAAILALRQHDRNGAAVALEAAAAVAAPRVEQAALEALAEMLREEPEVEEPEEPEELDIGTALREFADDLRDIVPLLAEDVRVQLRGAWSALEGAGNAAVLFPEGPRSKKAHEEAPARQLAALDAEAVCALVPLMLADAEWRMELLEALEAAAEAMPKDDALAAFLKKLRA